MVANDRVLSQSRSHIHRRLRSKLFPLEWDDSKLVANQ